MFPNTKVVLLFYHSNSGKSFGNYCLWGKLNFIARILNSFPSNTFAYRSHHWAVLCQNALKFGTVFTSLAFEYLVNFFHRMAQSILVFIVVAVLRLVADTDITGTSFWDGQTGWCSINLSDVCGGGSRQTSSPWKLYCEILNCLVFMYHLILGLDNLTRVNRALLKFLTYKQILS